jgi:hypothetical protein
MPSPTLANLETKLRNAEARARRLLMNTWVMPMSAAHYRTPHKTGEYLSHTNLVTRVIPAIRREISNKRKRNAAKRHWGRVKQYVTARGVVGHLQKLTMRPPNAGGSGYRRMMRQTNVGKKRTRSVGTSMSPTRRSPKHRNTGTSP